MESNLIKVIELCHYTSDVQLFNTHICLHLYGPVTQHWVFGQFKLFRNLAQISILCQPLLKQIVSRILKTKQKS